MDHCAVRGLSYFVIIIIFFLLLYLLVGLVEKLKQRVHSLVESAAGVLRRLLAPRCDLSI